MDVPLEIAFRNMDSSEFVERRVREKVEKLERFFDHISSMRVVVEAPNRSQHQGGLYQVTIEIGVPGKRLMVDRAKPHDHSHEDVLCRDPRRLRRSHPPAGGLCRDPARRREGP